jgi:hypothetical protein
MNRIALIVAITTNLICGYLLWNLHNEYDNLLTWACESASLGGHECGED